MAVKITQACEPAVVAHFARVAKVTPTNLQDSIKLTLMISTGSRKESTK